MWAAVPGGRAAFAETAVELSGDRPAREAFLRIAVRGDERAVGRAFSSAVVETTLASYPGAFYTGPPSGAQEVARYWPTTVAAAPRPAPEVELEGGGRARPGLAVRRRHLAPGGGGRRPGTAGDHGPRASGVGAKPVTVPLGVLAGARWATRGPSPTSACGPSPTRSSPGWRPS